ncbi:MAG: NAD-dependent epimerase/dehydratase family protein [Vicinamibacteria bacterium]|nr:NAD-dependent epimerase/dehydratase family protein [Vicinamibacteria bacterium]
MEALANSLAGRDVLVTGGCGFIGSRLVARLVECGARRVVALDSLRYGRRESLAGLPEGRVEVLPFDLGRDDPARLPAALDGITHVFHLAAEKHNQSRDAPPEVIRANVTGTWQLLDAATRAGVNRLVFASSLYAYGRLQGEAMRESEVPQPTTVYGISKLAGEHLCAHFARERGLDWVALRFFFVYGPGQWQGQGYKSVIVGNFERLARGERPLVRGDGRQALDYVYLDDAVAALLSAMERAPAGSTLNVASGRGLEIGELTRAMIEVAGRPDLEPEPAPADWTAGTRRVGDPERAAAELGFRVTTPLETGLRETWDWVRRHR